MGLNPAFQQQSPRTLPISFGYTLLSGDQVLDTVTIAGTPYVLCVLGEGEMDGKEIPVMYLPPVANTRSGLGTGNGTTSLCRGLSTSLSIFSQLTSGTHFHPGRYGIKGGMGFVSVGGGDQELDSWFVNFPSVTPPQKFSGIAYELTLGPGPLTVTSGSGDDTMSFSPSPAPIGVYRGLRCRTFDAAGNVTGYGFTLNPAWHMVEVMLRYKFKSQQPPLAGLTDAEKACFDWPSVVAFAERNAVTLSNGNPRFIGNYIFTADATMTDMLETMCRCSRSYIVRIGRKIYLMADDDREAGFVFSGNHLVPGSLSLDKKNVTKAPNVFIPKFRDLNVPAVAACVTIDNFETMGLDSSSPFIPRGQQTVKLVTDGINPFTIGSILVLGGSHDLDDNPSWDGNYAVGFPFGDGAVTDIGVVEDGVTILAPGPGFGIAGGASGGYLGAENARFAERAPTNVRHRAHQKATGGPDAPGLSSRLNVVPVEYDMGNTTFDQAIRLMTFEMIRTLGPDTDDWKAPFTGKVTGYLESVDANGKALIDQVPGSVITLDEWVTPEFAGDYEVLERVITGASSTSLGTIELTVQSRTDSSAYTDVVVDADATFFTVPNAGLNLSDRMPAMSGSGTRPCYVMQCTPYWDGTSAITAIDTSLWWAGDTAPTAYAFEVDDLEVDRTYVLYMQDPDGAGSDIGYFAVAGDDFSAIPDGNYIPLGVLYTGSGGGGGTGGTGGGLGPGPSLNVFEGADYDQAEVDWGYSGAALSFTLQRTIGASAPDDSRWETIFSGGGSVFIDTGLLGSTSYWWRIQAVLAGGASDWSDPFNYSTPPG